jgi:SAM-dependent methyltransferase
MFSDDFSIAHPSQSLMEKSALLPPVIETAPYMLADGGALDVDRCPDCWERRAHIERYVWAAKVCKRMRVLDFGCGVGYGSEILAGDADNIVVGIDTSKAALDLLVERRPDCVVQIGDRVKADWQFDSCVAFEVLEHLDAPGTFIQTVKARHLIASVPVRPDDDNAHHKHHFTIESFKTLVETRFKIVSWWLQLEPYHNYPSICIVHGEER